MRGCKKRNAVRVNASSIKPISSQPEKADSPTQTDETLWPLKYYFDASKHTSKDSQHKTGETKNASEISAAGRGTKAAHKDMQLGTKKEGTKICEIKNANEIAAAGRGTKAAPKDMQLGTKEERAKIDEIKNASEIAAAGNGTKAAPQDMQLGTKEESAKIYEIKNASEISAANRGTNAAPKDMQLGTKEEGANIDETKNTCEMLAADSGTDTTPNDMELIAQEARAKIYANLFPQPIEEFVEAGHVSEISRLCAGNLESRNLDVTKENSDLFYLENLMNLDFNKIIQTATKKIDRQHKQTTERPPTFELVNVEVSMVKHGSTAGNFPLTQTFTARQSSKSTSQSTETGLAQIQDTA